MLSVGHEAPDFTLPDDSGESVSLRDLLAHGPVVLFFYPADFTPVCTKEACMFRDHYAELSEAGIQVVGISPQGTDSKRKFREQHELPYPLLADEKMETIRAYQARGPFGLLVRRLTYRIAQDGTIADAICADLRVTRHEQFVQAALAASRA